MAYVILFVVFLGVVMVIAHFFWRISTEAGRSVARRDRVRSRVKGQFLRMSRARNRRFSKAVDAHTEAEKAHSKGDAPYRSLSDFYEQYRLVPGPKGGTPAPVENPELFWRLERWYNALQKGRTPTDPEEYGLVWRYWRYVLAPEPSKSEQPSPSKPQADPEYPKTTTTKHTSPDQGRRGGRGKSSNEPPPIFPGQGVRVGDGKKSSAADRDEDKAAARSVAESRQEIQQRGATLMASYHDQFIEDLVSTSSVLSDVPGAGNVVRNKLVRHSESVRKIGGIRLTREWVDRLVRIIREDGIIPAFVPEDVKDEFEPFNKWGKVFWYVPLAMVDRVGLTPVVVEQQGIAIPDDDQRFRIIVDLDRMYDGATSDPCEWIPEGDRKWHPDPMNDAWLELTLTMETEDETFETFLYEVHTDPAVGFHLEIVEAILDVWLSVIEENREQPFFSLPMPGQRGSIRPFDSFESLNSWVEGYEFSEAADSDVEESAAGTEDSISATPTPNTAQILVIEDERDIAALMAYHLTKGGYRVRTVESGDDAMEVVRNERPDMVVLDLMLSGVSGYEFLEEFRRQPQMEGVPVVVLTARKEESDPIEDLELGADDVLTKPFSPQELVLRIGVVLRQARANRATPAESMDVSADHKRLGQEEKHQEPHHEEAADSDSEEKEDRTIVEIIERLLDPDCPASFIEEVVLDPSPGGYDWGTPQTRSIWRLIALHSNAPWKFLKLEWENTYDLDEKVFVLASPACPEELLNSPEALEAAQADGVSYSALRALAASTRTPPRLLSELAQRSESHLDSLIREAVAENRSTPAELREQLITDTKRWVRQAAARTIQLDEHVENVLLDEGDRYTLKGLAANPACSTSTRNDIETRLADFDRYPKKVDRYRLGEQETALETYEFVAGRVPVEEVAEAVLESIALGGEEWERCSPKELHEYDDVWHEYGPVETVDRVWREDSEDIPVEFEPTALLLKKKYGDFSLSKNSERQGEFVSVGEYREWFTWGWVEFPGEEPGFELEGPFRPECLVPTVFPFHSYEYEDPKSGEEVTLEGEAWEGGQRYVEGTLFVRRGEKIIDVGDFAELREDMEQAGINLGRDDYEGVSADIVAYLRALLRGDSFALSGEPKPEDPAAIDIEAQTAPLGAESEREVQEQEQQAEAEEPQPTASKPRPSNLPDSWLEIVDGVDWPLAHRVAAACYHEMPKEPDSQKRFSRFRTNYKRFDWVNVIFRNQYLSLYIRGEDRDWEGLFKNEYGVEPEIRRWRDGVQIRARTEAEVRAGMKWLGVDL